MRRSKRNRLLKVLGGIIAGTAVLCAAVWFTHSRMEGLRQRIGELSAAAQAQHERMTKVLCIGRDADAGERLKAEDFSVVDVPREALPADRVASVSELEGRILRIPVGKGAYITEGMLIGETPMNDLRELRYGCIRTDSGIKTGDCIDVRIRYTDGTDYIVLSKKSVFGLDGDGILLRVGEEEILLMDSAAVDAVMFEGTYIYAAAYVEEMIQQAAIVNYTPAPAVIELIEKDPNVTKAAARYLSEALRNDMERRLSENAGD